MNTTNQLPEPELGYIKTDKSNQPAFSARQMREMENTNQLPPMPEPEGVIVVGTQALRGFTADQMRAYALQARAQVRGELEPYDAGILNDFGGGNVEWWQDYIRAELGRAHDFYQSQLAPSQAEVTDGIRPEDFTVDVVVKPMGGFAPANTQGVRVTHKPTGISVTCDAARSQHANRQQAFEKLSAILAQRPERVPMTDEQISLEAHNADDRDWNDLRFRSSWHEGFLEGARFAEAHHGITAQAKKETP